MAVPAATPELISDSTDVVIAKRLLDYAKQAGFAFQRTAPDPDAPLVGYRISDDYVDLIHIEGFSRDCFAWRKRTSSLITSQHALMQRHAEGSALHMLNEVLAWEPQAARPGVAHGITFVQVSQ
jgi:hypothetical protein